MAKNSFVAKVSFKVYKMEGEINWIHCNRVHTTLDVQMPFCIGKDSLEWNEKKKVNKRKSKQMRDFPYHYCEWGLV